MPIINDSNALFGAPPAAPNASFDAVIELAADFAPVAYAPPTFEIDSIIEIDSDFAPVAEPPPSFEFDSIIEILADFVPTASGGVPTFVIDSIIELVADFQPDTALVLTPPVPITRTIAAGAFTVQRYAAGGGRLYINNVLTEFVSAEINAPAKSLGKSLKIELASANLAQLPAGAVFKFQIGKVIAGGEAAWTTILDGGKLEGRSFSMSVGRDSLNFSTTAETEKLGICPRNNLIVYDPSKAEISIDEIETIPTNTGEVVTTTRRAVNVLTLKKLLNIAFVEGCGFASVSTDIPNYEIARCDFTMAQSYASAVAQFIGMYEPEFSAGAAGNLLIQKTVNPLPIGYTPNALTVSKIPSFTETAEYPASSIDGYNLIYTGTGGTRPVDRLAPAIVEPMGEAEFGDADFVEVKTTRKYRDWFEPDNPVAVRTELKEETVETRRNGTLAGREIKINKFDALGRSVGYTNTLEARIPDVNNAGVPSLLKTHEESQKIVYKSNPFAPRQTVLSKIETSVSALLAIDSDNTALDFDGNDSPYGQDYAQVFEHGNLKLGMTSAFRTLDVTTERFRPLASGQIEVRSGGFNYLSGKPKKPHTDIRSGDISIANFQKQRVKIVFKPGVTQATRAGRGLPPLNAGELPLFFAEPLADWLLANGRIKGQIEVTGYDESVERGVSFNLRGRGNEDLGNFLIGGYRVIIKPNSIMTNLDTLRV